MKLVFLGPPGAGKGTQAGSVSAALKIPHISTGDMFRAAIAEKTPTGVKAKEYLDAGGLVPDSVTIAMVDERLKKPDAASGYLLDGFPRTIPQAEALDTFAAPDAVIDIEAPEELILKRLTGRRVCAQCKGVFNTNSLKDEHVCPTCGGKLIHRDDDKPETVKERLKVYYRDTAPLIDYYKKQGKLHTVDGAGELGTVDKEILKILGAKE